MIGYLISVGRRGVFIKKKGLKVPLVVVVGCGAFLGSRP